jgi:hypothetical protein
MNNARRKELKAAISLAEEVKANLDCLEEILTVCKEEEEECYDNLPEGLQESDKGDRIQEAIDTLDDAINSLDEIRDNVDSLITQIDDVIQ